MKWKGYLRKVRIRPYLLLIPLASIVLTLLYLSEILMPIEGLRHCFVSEGRVAALLEDRKISPNFEIPTINGTLVVTFSNSGWARNGITTNWILSLRNVGISSPLVIALDSKTCSFLPKDTLCYFPEFVTQNTPSSSVMFGQKAYYKLMSERTRLILNLLSLNNDIFFADGDIVFLRNPLPYLQSLVRDNNYDALFQQDSTGLSLIDSTKTSLPYVCGGFFYMRSNKKTAELLAGVIDYQQNHFANDQAGLNICLWPSGLRWTTLSLYDFPTGKYIFQDHPRPIQGEDSPYIVHMNWIRGDEAKIRHMVENNIWYVPK